MVMATSGTRFAIFLLITVNTCSNVNAYARFVLAYLLPADFVVDLNMPCEPRAISD